jgi:hypothetical protein
MAMEKGLYQAPMGLENAAMMGEPPIEIEIEDPESVRIQAGGMELELTPDDETGEDFDANLAEYLDENVLGRISEELQEYYSTDIGSRKEWEDTYQEGIDLLGLKIEERTEPWDGACGVSHPILAEAVVKFQSETIMETFPASGPVKCKIVGRVTREKEEAAERVRDDMNYYLTEKMTDYRPEHERLLWNLPIAGCALKKVYQDPFLKRPVALFVPAEDFIVPYGATDLLSAPRYAHRMKKPKNEMRKLMVAGFYRDVELGEPTQDTDEIRKRKDDYAGMDAAKDDRFTLLEYHVDLDIEGYEDTDKDGEYTGIALPYVVHMEKGTGKVLAVYRNWKEDDDTKQKRIHFSKYGYIPGFGFYDFGLIHLVGGFAKGATSLLRQLVDAGTLSNLPGGLKSRGLRIKGDDTPIAPGEFRDVDVPSGAIKENIMTLPYKEPSMVLYQLLENIVAEGRRFAAVADVNVADMQPNAPVGSTLAVLERTLKTMSAIQARVHAAMKQEFKIIKTMVQEYAPAEYSYDVDAPEGAKAKQSDYDIVDIIPVSDPNASTMSQRIAQYQAVLQLAQTAPQLYDLPVLHRQMVEALGVRNADKLVPNQDDIKPMDPVSENMAVIKGDPIKAFMYQDHEAHIATHMAFAQDPKIQQIMQNDPGAQTKMAAGSAHIAEHVAFAYRAEIEKQLGVALPPPDEKLPEDVEVDLSRLTAQAAQRLLQKNQAEAQQQQAQQQMQDPIVQMQMQELQIKQGELQRKTQKDQMDHEIEKQRLIIELERIASSEKTQGAQLGARVVDSANKAVLQQEKLSDAKKLEGFRAGMTASRPPKPTPNVE